MMQSRFRAGNAEEDRNNHGKGAWLSLSSDVAPGGAGAGARVCGGQPGGEEW
jgi:hypothetical protein